ncbi:hypothetical protein LINPERPRIM_LOCUS26337 [Linum perenne]
MLQAFTGNLGVCTITIAELTGAVIGLERAWTKSFKDIEV